MVSGEREKELTTLLGCHNSCRITSTPSFSSLFHSSLLLPIPPSSFFPFPTSLRISLSIPYPFYTMFVAPCLPLLMSLLSYVFPSPPSSLSSSLSHPARCVGGRPPRATEAGRVAASNLPHVFSRPLPHPELPLHLTAHVCGHRQHGHRHLAQLSETPRQEEQMRRAKEAAAAARDASRIPMHDGTSAWLSGMYLPFILYTSQQPRFSHSSVPVPSPSSLLSLYFLIPWPPLPQPFHSPSPPVPLPIPLSFPSPSPRPHLAFFSTSPPLPIPSLPFLPHFPSPFPPFPIPLPSSSPPRSRPFPCPSALITCT
ncbi:unnamed protein product [Closterium sp. Naga37s-1]|nr:unnamed protein product [Closterium sp. Naga37s-1]